MSASIDKKHHIDTMNAKDKVSKALDQIESDARNKQAKIDYSAKRAGVDEWNSKADKAWNGDGNGKSVRSMAKDLKSPAKGYENFVALYGDIIQFSLQLSKALSLSIGTSRRLANLAGEIGGGVAQAWKGAGKLIGKAMGEGSTLKLPDSMIQSSHIGAQGQLTFDSLEAELPPGTRADLVEMLEDLNKSMVKAFLVSKGYSEDSNNPDVFTKQDASGQVIPLNDSDFSRLKNDPTDGLAAFSEKNQRIKLTSDPVTFEGGQPEEPTPFKMRP